ncbi:hypothetical protein BH24DEI1_BH24DEI1_15830 [soil metagenome]
MIDSEAMTSRDTTLDILGYGSHLIIDGFGAEAGALGDRARLTEALENLAATLEGVPLREHTLEEEDGLSSLLGFGEAHLSLHSVVNKHSLSLNVFSRRTLEPERLVSALRERFAPGRVESYLTSRSRTYHERLDLAALLRGERSYTCARLDDTLIAVEPR